MTRRPESVVVDTETTQRIMDVASGGSGCRTAKLRQLTARPSKRQVSESRNSSIKECTLNQNNKKRESQGSLKYSVVEEQCP